MEICINFVDLVMTGCKTGDHEMGCESESSLIEKLLLADFSFVKDMIPNTTRYNTTKEAIRAEILNRLEASAEGCFPFGQFGTIYFPFFNMGAVDSTNLFDLDELIIFNFYWKNRPVYKKMVDMGANLGLHSVIGGICGYKIDAFEPDPVHFELLQTNIEKNCLEKNIVAHNAACSDKSGTMSFCRVKGNTTGSHLAGAKSNPYGELDYFDVHVENVLSYMAEADLVKMDVEGHESVILCATDRELWEATDALVEIQNDANAKQVFDHMSKLGVNMFAQCAGWQRVKSKDAMPSSYKQGTLFISCKPAMPW